MSSKQCQATSTANCRAGAGPCAQSRIFRNRVALRARQRRTVSVAPQTDSDPVCDPTRPERAPVRSEPVFGFLAAACAQRQRFGAPNRYCRAGAGPCAKSRIFQNKVVLRARRRRTVSVAPKTRRFGPRVQPTRPECASVRSEPVFRFFSAACTQWQWTGAPPGARWREPSTEPVNLPAGSGSLQVCLQWQRPSPKALAHWQSASAAAAPRPRWQSRAGPPLTYRRQIITRSLRLGWPPSGLSESRRIARRRLGDSATRPQPPGPPLSAVLAGPSLP